MEFEDKGMGVGEGENRDVLDMTMTAVFACRSFGLYFCTPPISLTTCITPLRQLSLGTPECS